MYYRPSIYFPIAMALLLAIITFWINLTVQEQGPKIDGSSRHDPDYTMNQFYTTQTDATGKTRYVLAAAEMVHYPDDDSTVLQRPRFTQYTLDKPYTQIEGLRGYVSSNGEEIELVDNVKVVREAFNGKGEMRVLTENLTILPQQDIAKTNSPVVITQAPKTRITATGMLFDKAKKTVTLYKRVKAHYEKPVAKQATIKQPSAKQLTPPKPKLSSKPPLATASKKKVRSPK